MKRLFTSVFLLAVLLLTASSVSAQTSYTDDQGVQYSIADGKATITGYTGSATTITIPATVNGATFVAIGANAFKGNTTLATVNIESDGSNPSDLLSIGESAFEGCTSLTAVNGYLRKLVDIGDKACSGCTSLVTFSNVANKLVFAQAAYSTNIGTPVKVGKEAFKGCKFQYLSNTTSVGELGEGCFEDCTELANNSTSGTTALFTNLRQVPARAFKNCSKLERVGNMSHITSYGDEAFSGCSSLITIGNTANKLFFISKADLGEETLTVGKEAFKGCKFQYVSNATQVSSFGEGAFEDCAMLANDIENIFSFSGATEIPARMFKNCVSLQRVGNVAKVTTIGESAFEGCSAFTAYGNEADIVRFPSGLTAIGASAFTGCDALVEVQVPWETPLTITEDVFSATAYAAATLKVPVGTEDAYAAATGWEKFTNVVTGIRTIENVENTVTNDAWYTVDGKRLQGEPATKGVYIHNNKKVVVK